MKSGDISTKMDTIPWRAETELIHGNMPLSFGAMYLYKKGGEIIAGYWQYS